MRWTSKFAFIVKGKQYFIYKCFKWVLSTCSPDFIPKENKHKQTNSKHKSKVKEKFKAE